jgi:putative spermidine/putrescine transport system substrate-binding protein
MTKLTRRQLVQATAVGVLATPLARPALAQERTITIALYSGVFQESYQTAVIDPFMRAHPGVRVMCYPMPNSAQTLGTLRAQKAAPQVDIAILDVGVARAGTDEGLFAPLTPETMPVLSELGERAFTPGTNGVAVTYDSLALLYAPDKVKPAPTSWKVLWDPAYKGQIAILGAPDLVGIAFTLVADKLFGGTDYTKSLDKGISALSDLAPSVLSWDPRPDPYAFVVGGSAVLGVGWNARAQLYSQQSPGKLAVAQPDEGSVFQVNYIAPVNGAPQTDAARAFIAYALGTEAQKAFTEKMFYAPTNPKAQIAPAALARTVASPARMEKMLQVDWLQVAKVRDRLNDQWRRRILTRS